MSARRERIAVAWSGGKDSARAYLWAVEAGYEVACLVSAVVEETRAVAFHGTPMAVLEAQAHSMRLPLIASGFTAETAREVWLGMLGRARELGVTACVFGDDHNSDSRNEFYVGVFSEAGIERLTPFVGTSAAEAMRTFAASGVRAIIVATNRERVDDEMLGQTLDTQTVALLARREGVDVGGAYGEYHTLVVDAPFFRERLEVRGSETVESGKYLTLGIEAWELAERPDR